MLQSPWSMHVMSSAPQASLPGVPSGWAVPHTGGGVRGRLGDARSEHDGDMLRTLRMVILAGWRAHLRECAREA